MTYKLTSHWKLSASVQLAEDQRFDCESSRGYGSRAKLVPVQVQQVSAERSPGYGGDVETTFRMTGRFRKADGTVGLNGYSSGYRGEDPDTVPAEIREALLDALSAAASEAQSESYALPVSD